MAKAFVDISMVGDKALERKLSRLVNRVQKKVVRGALRKSATRIKKAIVANTPVHAENTGGQVPGPGQLKAGMKGVKPFTPKGSNRRGVIERAIPMPTEAALGIPPGAKFYYPRHVEFGHPLKGGGHVPPKAFIRGTVNDNTDSEIAQIGRDIGKGIEREAAKK